MAAETVEKVRIRFSKYSLAVINSDIQTFYSNDPKIKMTVHKFINNLVCKYYAYADCSAFLYNTDSYLNEWINKLTEEYRKELKNNSITKDQIVEIAKKIQKINTNTEYHNIRPMKSNGETMLFTPSSELWRIIEKNKIDATQIIDGDYISSLVEEYAHKPYSMREKILFRDVFDLIEDAIKNNTTLKRTDGEYNHRHIKPYKIINDSTIAHNYLVCMVSILDKYGQPGKYKIACYRIYRLNNMLSKVENDSYLSKETLSKEDIKRIDEALGCKPVSFLSETKPAESFQILLTVQGIKKYNEQIHKRPIYSTKPEEAPIACEDGSKIYTFYCTEDQISAYFTEFCADAIILSPQKYQKQFLNKYKVAADAYLQQWYKSSAESSKNKKKQKHNSQ